MESDEPSVNDIKKSFIPFVTNAAAGTVNSSRAVHSVVGADELIPHAVQTFVTYSNLRAAG